MFCLVASWELREAGNQLYVPYYVSAWAQRMRFDSLVSQFINLVSGSKLPVSSSLEPSKHVGVADYSDAKGRLVKLIDTPGLDVKSGDDILKEIMVACPPVKR